VVSGDAGEYWAASDGFECRRWALSMAPSHSSGVKPMPVSSMVINDIRLDVHQSALSLKVV
jgi:hypothetical protein